MIAEYDHGARGPRDTRSHTQYTPTNQPNTSPRVPDAALTSLEADVVERWTAPDQAGAVTAGAAEGGGCEWCVRRLNPVTRPPLLPHTRRHAETDDGPRVRWEGAVAAAWSHTDLFAFPSSRP